MLEKSQSDQPEVWLDNVTIVLFSALHKLYIHTIYEGLLDASQGATTQSRWIGYGGDPPGLLAELDLKPDASVDMTVKSGKLLLEASARPHFTGRRRLGFVTCLKRGKRK